MASIFVGIEFMNQDPKRSVLHRHHKIPTHAGGTNDPDNIELLTVSEHAEAHRLLYEKYGRIEDKLAWLGLSGIVGREEIVREAQRLGGRKTNENGNPWKGRKTASNWAINKGNLAKTCLAAHSDAARIKRTNTFVERGHQRGLKNSNFGKSSYADKDGNRKQFKTGSQPFGWLPVAEYLDSKKNKNHNCYGKHWWNNGKENFLLSSDEAELRKLTRGRLNSFKTA